MIVIGLGITSTGMRRSGTSIDSDAAAYSAAMGTPLTTQRLASVSEFTAGLKAAGLWNKLDWLLWAGETSSGGLVNMRRPSEVGTLVNSPGYTTLTGWLGNGSSAYIDLGETFNGGNNVYSLNSAHAGAVCTVQTNTTSGPMFGGVSDARLHCSMAGGGTTEVFSVNDTTLTNTRASSSKLGHRMVARGAAGTKSAYYNGELVIDASVTSTSQPAGNMCVLRRSTVYSPDRIGFFHSGSFLTLAEQRVFYELMARFLSAVGTATFPPFRVEDSMWSIAAGAAAGQATVTLGSLPFNGGSAITGVEYRVNGGSAVSLGISAPGTAAISGLGNGATPNIELRAVNAAGSGMWSPVKTVTTYAVPSAFTVGQWTLAQGAGQGQLAVTLSAMPANGGTAITGTSYRLDGGSAVSLGLTAAGSATISGLSADTEYDVEIRASNLVGAGAWSDLKSATTLVAAPTNTVAPVISGSLVVGSTLSVSTGTWTGSPTLAYQWRVDGVDVSGATSTTFATTGRDIGDVVTCRVTGTNASGSASVTTSGVTLTEAAPTNTVAPAISGDTEIGSTLSVSTGTWTGSPTLAYQWRVNGVDESGETATTFDTTGLADGDVITCRVTGTNGGGSANVTTSGVTLTDGAAGPVEIPNAILTSGRSSEMVAPEGITFSPDLSLVGTHFDISAPGGVYDARMHDVYYVWSFGEAGSFTAPQHLLSEHMDRNRATGPAVAHVYRAPGTYTVRLDMYGTIDGDPAHAYSERTVTVGSSASMFAGSQTYFVSPSSDWTNAPSGSQHVTSLDDAAGWANEGGGPYRIMLNRGETHLWGGRRFGFNTPETCTIHIVAGPGGGAKPILTCTGSFGCGGFDDATYVNKAFVAQGLVLNGPYDPITPGDPEVTGAFGSFGDYTPQQMLIDDCEIRNFGSFMYVADNTSRHIYMHDNIMEGYGQWGVTGSHADGLILLGNRILSAAGAPIDNDANMGGTVRTGAGIMTFISYANDIECAQGWSGLGGGRIAVQPCIRVESEGVAGQTINIAACTFAGGFTQVSIANGDDPSVILNAIIDGCYFLGSYQSGDVIGTENAGTTVRNNVAVIPNPATRFGPGLSYFVVLGNAGGGPSLAPPMKVYGNTIVNYTTDTLGIVSNGGGYSNVTVENNVSYQPNASPAQTADAPLTTTPALWTPRELGYMDRATPRITATATPSGAPAAYSLDTGSDALGDATTGLIAPFNIVGDERSDPPNRGAW